MTDKQSEAPDNAIIFMPKPTKEVMRITLNGVHVADGVSVDEATAGVIDVLDAYIKNMVQREVKRLDALNVELVEALRLIQIECDNVHHLKKHRHTYAESCKAKEWINSVLAKAEGK